MCSDFCPVFLFPRESSSIFILLTASILLYALP